MAQTLIRHARLINEGKIYTADVLIKNGFIEKIDSNGINIPCDTIIDASGKWLIPGCIDDQVHFREPGLTHKANISTESAAAVAGGVTSFMEMPNTIPPAVSINVLEEKYKIASENSHANYSFYLGASNDNYEELIKLNPQEICGIKVFLGSSTGNLLVDNPESIRKLFSIKNIPIAAHCEDDEMIKIRNAEFKEKYGANATAELHPEIRNAEACYRSSSMAVKLAKVSGARLHVLHISTSKELDLFDNSLPLAEKKITAEACVHHLWFSDQDYEKLGNKLKWNPAVKSAKDREAIMQALIVNRIDVIATDHAPHTISEKALPYFEAPSGGPLIQYALLAMLEKVKNKVLSIEKVVEKMCHNPAILFDIDRRGFIREGFYADLVLIDPLQSTKVEEKSILSLCKWSPFEGMEFSHSIDTTWVNGQIAYTNNQVNESVRGMRMKFLR